MEDIVEPTEMSKIDWRELEASFPMKVFLTVLYSAILLLGIIGNSVTIQTANVLRNKGYLQKNVTDHMVSLAGSDLLVLLIGMPVELYSATWFPFESGSGDVQCKIYNFLFETCSYATLLNVATMSFERFVAICYPFRYKTLSERRTAYLILFAWLTAVLVALPLLFATGKVGHVPKQGGEAAQNLTFCTNLPEHWVMYQTSISIAFVVYIVVLVSVAFMCRSMVKVIKAAAGNVSKTESTQVKAARKQTIIFLGLIVLALVICWFPNQVRRLMTVACSKSEWTQDYLRSYATLHPVADTFFYLSSVVNPFLYNLSSKQFRQTFIQVLLCRPTLEHVNRRNLSTPWSAKTSMIPLMRKSRRQQSSSPTESPQKQEPCMTSQNDDSGVVLAGSVALPDPEVIELHNGAKDLGKWESEI